MAEVVGRAAAKAEAKPAAKVAAVAAVAAALLWALRWERRRDARAVLLFYEYTSIEDVEAAMAHARALCERWRLLGRLRVSAEGFNGNLAGRRADLDSFVVDMQRWRCATTDFKFADIAPSQDYKALKVWEAPDVCGLFAGARDSAERLQKTQALAREPRGVPLTAREFHRMLDEEPGNVALFDARNLYETRIGRFKVEGAEFVDPETQFFHELPNWFAAAENLERMAGKKILMYCTGGVRCERSSALLRTHLPDAPVFQLSGGIHRYLEEYPDGGHFAGKMHVYDRRGNFGPRTISECQMCRKEWDRYQAKKRCACGMLLCVCVNCQGYRAELQCERCARGGSEAKGHEATPAAPV